MKIYKILYSILCISLFACTIEEKNLFDKSSSTRMTQALLNTREVLAGAPNGWIAAYYPSPSLKYGGYNLLLSFTKEGKVTAMSEIDPEKKAESEYTTYQSAGVILSLNAYNDVIQYFTSPLNPDGIGKKGEGMQGDMEFRVLVLSSGKIILSGKKYGKKIVLTPMKNGVDWTEYLKKIAMAEKLMTFRIYEYKAGNITAKVTLNNRNMNMCYEKDGIVVEEKYPFMPTSTGYSLYDTLRIGGVKTKELVYAFDDTYIFKGEEGATLQGMISPLSELVQSGTWSVSPETFSPAMLTLWENLKTGVENPAIGEEIRQVAYQGGNQFFIVSGRYKSTFFLTMSQKSADTVRIVFNAKITDGNAKWYITNVPGFLAFAKAFDGEFKLSSDEDPRNPKKIKFTSIDKPDMSFTVSSN